jgi:hypothetical protein
MALPSVAASQCHIHVHRLYALKGMWLNTEEQAIDTDHYTLHNKDGQDAKHMERRKSLL